MTLREFKQNIDKMLKDNPGLADLPVIYSCDDEGNTYQKVVFAPSGMCISNIEEDRHLEPEIYEEQKVNCICIN